MTTDAKKQSPIAAVGGVAGAIGGWVLAKYSGASLLIPSVGAILLLLAFMKTSFRPRYFRGAISVTGGHVLWFAVAALILGTWAPVILDIAALSVGIVWLWFRPGLASAVFLGIVELVSLAINVAALLSATVGEPSHRSLVVNCLFRVLVLACLAAGYRRLRQDPIARVEAAAISLPPRTHNVGPLCAAFGSQSARVPEGL
jgi:hypothetical protein